MEFVWFALIGICAGWLAGQITKGSGFGIVGDLIVGVIGALGDETRCPACFTELHHRFEPTGAVGSFDGRQTLLERLAFLGQPRFRGAEFLSGYELVEERRMEAADLAIMQP